MLCTASLLSRACRSSASSASLVSPSSRAWLAFVAACSASSLAVVSASRLLASCAARSAYASRCSVVVSNCPAALAASSSRALIVSSWPASASFRSSAASTSSSCRLALVWLSSAVLLRSWASCAFTSASDCSRRACSPLWASMISATRPCDTGGWRDRNTTTISSHSPSSMRPLPSRSNSWKIPSIQSVGTWAIASAL